MNANHPTVRYLKTLINATLDLMSFKSDAMTAKAWILPSGKAVMVPQLHYIWLDKNRERVKKEFGLDIPAIRGMQDDQMSRMWALNHGFARVNYKPASGRLTIEANKRFWSAGLRDALVALVAKNAGAIDFIEVNILDDNAKLLPVSDSANLSMEDDEDKPGKIPVAARHVRARLVAAAFARLAKKTPPQKPAKAALKEIPDLLAFKSDKFSSKLWITPPPYEKVIPLDDHHYVWLRENKELLKQQYDIEVPEDIQNSGLDARNWAMSHGFVRVSYERKNGLLIFECNERYWTSAVKRMVLDIVKHNVDAVDSVMVNVMDDQFKTVGKLRHVEFYGLDEDDKMRAVKKVLASRR